MMKRSPLRGFVFATALALALGSLAVPAQAQQPSPGAIAAAKELIEVKGASNMFDPVVAGVIESARTTFLRTNPGLARELNEVAAALKREFDAKRTEIALEVARVFATRFTEQELRDAVAFYKTPLGRKLITEEARAMEESMTRVQSWAEKFSEEVVTRMRAEMRKRGHAI